MSDDPTAHANPAPIRFCTQCGTPVGEGGSFCVGCGGPLAAEAIARPGRDHFACPHCGGEGRRLPPDADYCPHCRWLRPLGADYTLPPEAFLYRLDAEAMSRLRALGPITSLAHTISERYGRPWFEAAVNGVRLSERQLPDIFEVALQAARVVGLRAMPEVYVSGNNMWDAATLGSDSGAFVVIGAVLANFRGEDLFFLLAREMGRVRAGHALWRTVYELVAGRRNGPRSLMGDGMMQWLNPSRMIEGAVEAPLLAWARHSEITADRAGQLAVGKFEAAQRVLLQWTLKSLPLYQRLNLDDWAEQEESSARAMVQASEFAMSSQPYIARRLRLAREFQASEDFAAWRLMIEHWRERDPGSRRLAENWRPKSAPAADGQPKPEMARLVCSACQKPMLIPRAQIPPDRPVNVRCPNPACGKVLSISVKSPSGSRTPEETSG